MSYLLDTNVVSEMGRPLPDKRVTQWIKRQPPSLLHVSVLTFGEIRKGINALPISTRADSLRAWMEETRADFRDRVLPIDEPACEVWAELTVRRPLPIIDGLLMGTAISRGLTFVTRDDGHPRALGVPVLNPWET